MPRREGTPRSSINHIVVTGYEKKKQPSKHYVFVVDVIWDNDERYEVLRRYSEFFTLNETLQLVFPAGKNANPSTTLPNLPKRKLLGRSHVEKVAEARVESINKYCQALIRLNIKISQSKQVLTFFSPKIGDRTLPKLRLQRPASIHPMIRPAGNTVWEEHCVIASFIGEGPNQLSAESGEQVRVVNKDKSGWWLVERKGKVGWMPESYLKKCSDDIEKVSLGLIDVVSSASDSKDSDDSDSRDDREDSPNSIEIEAQDYKAIDSFHATEPGQLSFDLDDIITVLDKMEDGWWFVAKGKQEGWVPCGYLEPVGPGTPEQEKISESAVATDLDFAKQPYKTLAAYNAEEEDEISFAAGSTAFVIYKSLTGWWMINCEGKTGLAPATYLKKIEDETSSLNSSDSGIDNSANGDSGSTPLAIQKSFKQSPRQHTVRKKRSDVEKSTTNKSSPTTMQEEPVPKPRKGSQPMAVLPKPNITPRKFSNPDPIPQLSKDHLNVSTPPRPRQTLIHRAYATPRDEDSDEMEDRRERRKLSPSPINRRSPSPSRAHSPSPKPNRKLKVLQGNDANGIQSEVKAKDDNSSRDNPYVHQAAEAMIKYVLASGDSKLKEALIDIVSSDPEILKQLKQ